MTETIPSYVTEGKVLYCGKDGWWYVGKDPETDKPVLKDEVTKQFIVADESKITKPTDERNMLLCDFSDAHAMIVDGIVMVGKTTTHADIMGEVARILVGAGYTDGTTGNATFHNMFGVMFEALLSMIGVGHVSQSDLEITISDALYRNNFRKVVADKSK